MVKKTKYMALDPDFCSSFKSLAAQKGKSMLSLSREFANNPASLKEEFNKNKRRGPSPNFNF